MKEVMMTMGKGDVAAKLLEKFSDNLKRGDAQKIVDEVFAIITRALVEEGDDCRIHGFGTFEVAERSARTGRNPKTGETIAISARRTVRFRSASALKDALL